MALYAVRIRQPAWDYVSLTNWLNRNDLSGMMSDQFRDSMAKAKKHYADELPLEHPSKKNPKTALADIDKAGKKMMVKVSWYYFKWRPSWVLKPAEGKGDAHVSIWTDVGWYWGMREAIVAFIKAGPGGDTYVSQRRMEDDAAPPMLPDGSTPTGKGDANGGKKPTPSTADTTDTDSNLGGGVGAALAIGGVIVVAIVVVGVGYGIYKTKK